MVSFDSHDYQKMRHVNIEGTTNIVNLCIAGQIKKLCFVSSVATIENGEEGVVMDESENWNSATDKSGYAISKYGAEMEVWRGSQEGVPVVIVNPGIILGSGFWHKGSGKLFANIQKGLPFYTNGITGFVGVRDVVRIMIRLMGSGITDERYILVSENLTYREVLFMIADNLNKKRPNIHVNRLMTALIWRFEFLKSKITLSPPLLTKRTAKSSLSNHPYTAQKIRNAIDVEFEPIEACVKRISVDFMR
jgi:nucleoside-diphosphate-sugar epimerase